MPDAPDRVLQELEHPQNKDGWSQAAADLSSLTPDEFRTIATRFQADKKDHPDLPNIIFTDSQGKQSATLPVGRNPEDSPHDTSSPRQVVHPKQ